MLPNWVQSLQKAISSTGQRPGAQSLLLKQIIPYSVQTESALPAPRCDLSAVQRPSETERKAASSPNISGRRGADLYSRGPRPRGRAGAVSAAGQCPTARCRVDSWRRAFCLMSLLAWQLEGGEQLLLVGSAQPDERLPQN